MRSPSRLSGALALACLVTASAAAQVGGKPVTGNPTPGTPQPDPPNLADRVTLTGCVEVASKGGASTAAIDGNAVTDSRFLLTNAERQSVVPPDTGGSPFAAGAAGRTYRLSAIESQLSPFVGAKVEISGEIKPPAESPALKVDPTLQVEFVQKLAANCK